MAYKYCPYCGTSLEPEMKFCPNCGASLIAGTHHTNSPQPKVGTLTIFYDGYWVLIDAKYEFHYNGQHYSDFSFKSPFKYELPLVQGNVKLKVKKLFLYWTFAFLLDPSKDYTGRLTYDRIAKQFNLVVRDENNRKVYKDTLF